ncbi:glycoside hydrolase family 5 protein [Teredinibacter haidensis]|uniref:glycoside hydrolase family 5 protein n=1 Tax=Teredinibacter haidensis TaxID=2731755 RepID=UPI00094918B0|nr:cellulase family glycosylhydrolase [Teredinibacter haidensis]
MHFLTSKGSQFTSDNQNVLLRGAGLGNWTNLEHFLLGLPGTDSQIRRAIHEAYGERRSKVFWKKYYAVYVAEADIAFAKEQGFNHLRLPVNYRLFRDNAFEKSTAIRELDRVLALCKKYNIWGIIDLHAVPGGQNPDWHSDNQSGRDNFWQDKKAQAEMVQLWKNIAQYYRDEPAVGGYDLINEPCYFGEASEQAMLRFFTRCTEEIRKVDSHHLLIYTGNTYGRDFSMFERNLDENSAYTFHLYPFLQIASELESENLQQQVTECLYRDVTFEKLKQLEKPLWCGETGHPLHLNDKPQALKLFIALLEEQDVGWSLWPLKDCGAMALTHTSIDGKWNALCEKISNNWKFWKLFSEDSKIASEAYADNYGYYQWLAEETSKGWNVFRENLKLVEFEELMECLDDFKLESCVKRRLV